jgi:hypothetical protein
MHHVIKGVNAIDSYVTERLTRLKGELKGQESRTVQCFLCEQFTLVVGAAPTPVVGAAGSLCHFCGEPWPTADDLALEFVSDMYNLEPDYPHPPVGRCPRCGEYSWVDGVVFADSPEVHDTSYCFACGLRHRLHELTRCARCYRRRPIEAGADGTLCTNCLANTEPEETP